MTPPSAAEPIQDRAAIQREWWVRTAAVLVAPRPVFASLRDDSSAAAEARQEPIAAVVGLAGIAGVLSTSVARHVLDDPGTSTVIVPVWAFLGGAFYALAVYWLFGALLWAAARGLGSLGTYRRARHLLGLSLAPLALSLVTLWPIRIVVYGSDLFRAGGADSGRADAIFGAVNLCFAAWALVLLLVGVRTVHGWTWTRSAATIAIAAAVPALVVAVTTIK